MPDNELRHYGVPGMKWGHRRSSSSTSGPPKVGRVRAGLASVGKANQMARSVKPVPEKTGFQKIIAGEKLNGKDKRAIAGLAVGLALMASPHVIRGMQLGSLKLESAANAKVAARGAEAARNIFADKNGIGSVAVMALKQGADGRFR